LQGLSFVALVLHRVDPHFGAVVVSGRDSQIEALEALPSFSEIFGGTHPYSRLNSRAELVVIGVFLLEHADVAFAAADIHPLAGGVVIQVVRVLDSRKGRDQVSRTRVKHSQSRRHSGGDEEPVSASSNAIGKLLSKVSGQRTIECVLRLMTAICFKSGRFT